MQFMIRPMNFRVPTDEDIHTAFKQGEAAVVALFHDVATQMSELAQQVAKQGEILQELQARLAKTGHNSSKPPSSDGYGKGKRTTSLRKSGDKPNGGQPGHEGQTLMATEYPERTVTYEVASCAHCQASLQGIEVDGYEERQVFDLPAIQIDVTAPRSTGFDVTEYQEQADLAREGLALLADAPPERRAVLLEWAAFADFLVARLPELEKDWKAHREALHAAGELPDTQQHR